MDVPRLLAIDHVNMTAPFGTRQAVADFYVEVLGFEPMQFDDEARLVLRGFPRSDPRLIISMTETPVPTAVRRGALIQVGSLHACAEMLAERRMPFEWQRGWFFYSRRLSTTDPAGNLIEMVSSHSM